MIVVRIDGCGIDGCVEESPLEASRALTRSHASPPRAPAITPSRVPLSLRRPPARQPTSPPLAPALLRHPPWPYTHCGYVSAPNWLERPTNEPTPNQPGVLATVLTLTLLARTTPVHAQDSLSRAVSPPPRRPRRPRRSRPTLPCPALPASTSPRNGPTNQTTPRRLKNRYTTPRPPTHRPHPPPNQQQHQHRLRVSPCTSGPHGASSTHTQRLRSRPSMRGSRATSKSKGP